MRATAQGQLLMPLRRAGRAGDGTVSRSSGHPHEPRRLRAMSQDQFMLERGLVRGRLRLIAGHLARGDLRAAWRRLVKRVPRGR